MNKFQFNIAAVILAAGSGSRMCTSVTKQRIELLGKSVLLHSLNAFDGCDSVNEIVLVVRDDELEFAKEQAGFISKPVKIVTGGATRRESAEIGFGAVSPNTEYVAIHDAARCLITPGAIDAVVLRAIDLGAATAATPITDTVKRTDEDGFIVATVPRDALWAASTPQAFKTEIYRSALEQCKEEVTDDNMLAEALGIKIACVDVGRENIKITRLEDIAYAEFVLTKRGRPSAVLEAL